MLQALVFDFDMILIDSSDAMLHSFELLHQRFGTPLLSRDQLMEIIGLHDAPFWEASIGGLTPEILDFYLHTCLPAETPLLKPYAGAAESVDRLRARGLRTGCATNRRRGDRILKLTGLWPLMDCCVGAAQVVNPKPAPDMIELALQKLEVSPAEALYVGDTDLDVAAGRGAGLDVVALRTSMDGDALTAAGAWRVCDTLADLEALLESEGRLP